MNYELLVERMFPLLIAGDRTGARALVAETRRDGVTAEELAHNLYWPLLEMLGTLYRQDQLTTLAHHYGVRMLRSLIDQAQAGYLQHNRRGRSVLLFCGTAEADELSAQMVADIAEADGYELFFGGGGVANDEILAEVGERRPDILLMFASAAQDAPNIRQLIDTIREVGACPQMQIVVGGGVFNRAEGLAEEIGADVWARTPRELLQQLSTQKDRRATATQRTVGRQRQNYRAAAA